MTPISKEAREAAQQACEGLLGEAEIAYIIEQAIAKRMIRAAIESAGALSSVKEEEKPKNLAFARCRCCVCQGKSCLAHHPGHDHRDDELRSEAPTTQEQPPSETGNAEDRVIAEIQARRARGLAKYGVGTERTDLTRAEWLQHAKEEALDCAIYLERCLSEEPNHNAVGSSVSLPKSADSGSGVAEKWELVSDGADDPFCIIRNARTKETIAANIAHPQATMVIAAHNASLQSAPTDEEVKTKTAANASTPRTKGLLPEETGIVLGALDSLGVALAVHGHEWSDGERTIYEQAVEIMKGFATNGQ